MAFTYTRDDLKTRINAGLKGKIGILIDENDTINQAVRDVNNLMDLRSAKRRVLIAPGLFTDINSYPCPVDLNGQAIIDINPQDDSRAKNSEYYLVTPEEFYRRKDDRAIAIDNRDSLTRLLINAQINDKTLNVSTLDSLTAGGGTWAISGDATNLVANTDNFVKGIASLSFDITAAGGTTAGIKNTTLNTFDLTNYRYNSIFVWAYVVSTTGLTNYSLKIGTNTTNYFLASVTTTHEGVAFTTGWNLLRFDLATSAQTGTVTLASCKYAELYMTKTVGKVSETGYLFDQIQVKKGQYNNLYYYSGYGWTTSAGTWIQDSTNDSDFIVAGANEFNLMVYKGIELGASEMDEDNLEKKAQGRFKQMMEEYIMGNQSEAKVLTGTYYDFIS